MAELVLVVPDGRDVGGADAVAVGDGGQSLDMRAEQAGEDLGLGLAQLRELLGDVRDRAVVLAQLLPRSRAAARPGASWQRSRRRTAPSASASVRSPGGSRVDDRAVAGLELADPLRGRTPRPPPGRRCSARKRSALAARSS